MADYYSLLARAVANLPKSSPPSTRRAIYERARKALTNQLRSLKPQLPESDIAREERALDEAVARLEGEFEPAGAEIHTLPTATASGVAELVAAPPAPPPAPSAPSAFAAALRPAESPKSNAPRSDAARPEPKVAPPVSRMTPPRPAPSAPLKPPTPKPPPPAAAAPPSPPPPPTGGLPNAAAFKAPGLEAVEKPVEAPSSDTFEPQLGPARPEDLAGDEDDPAPALGSAGGRFERTAQRPSLADANRRKTPTWLWVGGLFAVGFAAVIAIWASLHSSTLRELTPAAPPVEQATDQPSPEAEKLTPRIGPSSGGETPAPAPAPAASETPTDQASTAPSPTPSVEASASPAPPPTPEPTPAPSPGPTVPIASRAAMLIATVQDAAKPAITVGTAVWSIVPAPAGQPNAIGVKAEIDIPDLKLHASMTLKKNFDTSLPASHTIDLSLSFEPGSPIRGIKDIALPLMRRDDPPAADALAGVRVKIKDNYYLIGLNRGDGDLARNVQEISERGWFDFPMQLDDDRIAKLTFEKGADGEKMVAQALAAWK